MILLDCIKFNGTLDERRAYTICKMNGVEYMTLSEEERLTLIRIFKKSSLYPAAISQRGKSKILSLFDRKNHRTTRKRATFLKHRLVAPSYRIPYFIFNFRLYTRHFQSEIAHLIHRPFPHI